MASSTSSRRVCGGVVIVTALQTPASIIAVRLGKIGVFGQSMRAFRNRCFCPCNDPRQFAALCRRDERRVEMLPACAVADATDP